MIVAGDPKGVAGIKGVVFTLAGVTACAGVPQDPSPDTGVLPLEVSKSETNTRTQLLTNHTIRRVQNIGNDIRARTGTENGNIIKRIIEANELSQEKLLVWNSRCREYPRPSTGKLWCRAK